MVADVIKPMNAAFSSAPQRDEVPLKMVAANCCLCDQGDSDTIGTGEDFEYHTSADKFTAMRCHSCGLVYLNPRPAWEEFARIYPSNYHAFEFSETKFGFVFKVRRRLEAKRLLAWCRNLPDDARIIDIGCGDGFHLEILKDFGKQSWQLEGVDSDERAVKMARRKGLTIHHGYSKGLPYDLQVMIWRLPFKR